jgi:hypothetical protein
VAVFSFYTSLHNPTGLVGTVGGDVSTEELQPKLGYLFSNMDTSDLSEIAQYRKVFIVQEEDVSMQDLYVEVGEAEYTGHVSFAINTSLGNTADSPITVPDDMSVADFSGDSSTPLYLTGTSTLDDQHEIWLKLTLPANVGTDELASFNLKVKGTRLN